MANPDKIPKAISSFTKTLVIFLFIFIISIHLKL
jgi:hypothetical protein